MNRHSIRLLPVILAACIPASPALAASSDWASVEGGSVRIVTDGLPDSSGMLRGALEIRLEPGWKTYWRDPGEAGIPPMVTVSNPKDAADVDIGFPVPGRFDDGYSVWAGYERPVSLALTFDLPDNHGDAPMDVAVFVGICESICIPLQADLRIDPGKNAEGDRASVYGAFAALPPPAAADFGARLQEAGEDRIVIDTALPAGAADPVLFVASTENWAFDTPKDTGGGSFEVPVLAAPEAGSAPESIHYTLVAGENAVAGAFELSR